MQTAGYNKIINYEKKFLKTRFVKRDKLHDVRL